MFLALHDPRTGVQRALLIGLLAALVANSLAACSDGPRPRHASDTAALVALYNTTDGLNWTNNTNWLSNQPIDMWYGVTSDGSGRVTHLELDENGLSGRLPPELGSLDNLLSLNLSWNRLSGQIPPELSKLDSLTSLYLHSNGLSGQIPPELGNLDNLTTLSLYANQLSGQIPPELGNLDNLRGLYLGSNQLSGQIPPELGNLNLTRLSLYNNQLTGHVPPELLGNMDNLTWLSLDGNKLTGCVPHALRDQLTSLPGIMHGMPFCKQMPPPRPCTAGMTLKPGEYCTIDTHPWNSPWYPTWGSVSL